MATDFDYKRIENRMFQYLHSICGRHGVNCEATTDSVFPIELSESEHKKCMDRLKVPQANRKDVRPYRIQMWVLGNEDAIRNAASELELCFGVRDVCSYLKVSTSGMEKEKSGGYAAPGLVEFYANRD